MHPSGAQVRSRPLEELSETLTSEGLTSSFNSTSHAAGGKRNKSSKTSAAASRLPGIRKGWVMITPRDGVQAFSRKMLSAGRFEIISAACGSTRKSYCSLRSKSYYEYSYY